MPITVAGMNSWQLLATACLDSRYSQSGRRGDGRQGGRGGAHARGRSGGGLGHHSGGWSTTGTLITSWCCTLVDAILPQLLPCKSMHVLLYAYATYGIPFVVYQSCDQSYDLAGSTFACNSVVKQVLVCTLIQFRWPSSDGKEALHDGVQHLKRESVPCGCLW